jgi:glycosyltransferase involved in cell wall biosynthesis
LHSILFIYGCDASWAIGNRAKNLASRLEGRYNVTKCTVDQARSLSGRFDLVHLHSITYFPFPTSLVGGTWGFSLVSYRSLDSVKRKESNGKAFARAGYVIAKSPDLEARARQVFRGPVRYIPNGVDVNLFRPRPYRIGWCGNKAPYSRSYKGVDLIRWAVKTINKAGKLQVEFVEDLSDPPRFVLPQEDMVKFYQGIDVFVSASLGEGCSNVVLEALACGVPVVMTRTGIYQDLAGAGVITVDRTGEGVKQGILKSLAHVDAARREMVQRFSWEGVANQYASFYASLGFPPG